VVISATIDPHAVRVPGQPVSRRRDFISRRRHVIDSLILCLLFLGTAGGIFLFGGVRVWSVSILNLFIFSAGILFCLRPYFNEELRVAKIPPGMIFLCLFLLYASVRLYFSAVKYEAMFDLLRIGGVLVAYYVWNGLGARVGRWRVLFAILILCVTGLCWYALIQQVHGTNAVLTLFRPLQYGMRASGTYMCPNHFANLLAMSMCLCLGLVLLRASGGWLRILSIYGLILSAPVLFLTQSRSGWIGAVAGMSVTGLLIMWRRNRKTFFILLILLPVMLIVIGASVWGLSPVARERLQGMNLSSPDGSVNIRFMLWKDTLNMIADQPIWGHDGGGYRWVYAHYKTHAEQLWARYAHNEYLQTIVEYGWVGFLLLAGAGLSIIITLLRAAFSAERERDSILAAVAIGAGTASLLHALFDFNFHIYANVQVLFFIIGISSSCLFASGVSLAKPMKSPWWWLASLAIVLCCLLFEIQTSRFLLSYYHRWKGDSELQMFHNSKAVEQYQRAGRILPMDWHPALKEADLYKARCFWERDPKEKKLLANKAMSLYAQAHELNPYDFEIQHGQSIVSGVLGKPERSLQYLRDVLDYAPNDLYFLNRYGIQLRLAGQLDEAMKIFQRAQKLGGGNITRTNIELIKEESHGR